jgi:hypothetical protein
VPLAAIGLTMIMVGAAIVEFRLGSITHVFVNLGYVALALFVACGRFGFEQFG